MVKPLDGILVIDLTRVLAGPYCTMELADMGATVIKVEIPGTGDDTRAYGPPFLNGESTYFLSVNRNKKSMTLNLKTDQGKEILRQLLRKGDVLVENFRPGTLESLGFGYDATRALNLQLIYCSISGFGQTGPYAQRPGYDLVVQGEGGVMSLTGEPDGPPMKVGNSFADITAGMNAFAGILLALLTRGRTGEGQWVDVSLLDCQAAMLTYQAGIYFATGRSPQRMGNQHPSITPYETFECSNGYINIAAGNQGFWERFCKLASLEHLLADERFGTMQRRIENRAALTPIIAAVVRTRTRREWFELLEREGIPCGLIKTVAEVCTDPQVLAHEMVAELQHPTAGPIKVNGIPIKLSATPGEVKEPPPFLGQHTDEVLADILGYTATQITELRQAKAV
ncbi:MAG: CoA transferase [Nitrospinae bacterium]|nr:CoA transferase [Nitrospinota bacterium]